MSGGDLVDPGGDRGSQLWVEVAGLVVLEWVGLAGAIEEEVVGLGEADDGDACASAQAL